MAIKTNKEYLVAATKALNLSEEDIEIIMMKSNVNPDADANVRECDMALYKRFSVVLGSAMQNVTEGGYSVSWNMEAVKMFYVSLCEDLGTKNVLVGRPKVRNRSNMW